jgi:hypothetical protein
MACSALTTLESFSIRDQRDRESHLLAQKYGFFKWRTKNRTLRRWNHEYGELKTEGNRWYVGGPGREWRQLMGDDPIGWICESQWITGLDLANSILQYLSVSQRGMACNGNRIRALGRMVRGGNDTSGQSILGRSLSRVVVTMRCIHIILTSRQDPSSGGMGFLAGMEGRQI